MYRTCLQLCRVSCWVFCWVLALCANGPARVHAAEPPAAPAEVLSDAELTDVVFLDPDRGLAIGERGVIWRTENGGRHWRLTPSPMACRLESIFFLDDQRGWIVGGYTQPLTHQSTGVILRTVDGGRTWAALPKLVLPGLKQIQFFDAKNGIVLGQTSDFSPSAIFRTSDGGTSWIPLPGAAPVGWHAGAFQSPQRGVVVGPAGQVAHISGQEMKPAQMPSVGARPVRRVAFGDPGQAWLVGDGGLVLASASGGLTWTMPPAPIPPIVREQMELRALAARGPACWIAGSPGSLVLHSADGGASWETFRTDQTAPLKALYFLDDQRGWAVGALGTILNTRDGGRTWLVQRQGGRRAAILALFSRPERVPLEILARESGSEGYLSATELLSTTSFSPSASTKVPLDERTQAAIALVGGSASDSAWRFPLRETELELSAEATVELWNRAVDGRATQELDAHLVRKIRMWRPDVILTERASPRGDDPLAHLTNQLVLTAVAHAADPTIYPDQIALLGLEPHKPRKVFSTLPPDTPGMVNVATAQLAPRLGSSLADAAQPACGLLLDGYRPAVDQWGLQLVHNTLPREIAVRDVMSGIALQPGSDARRMLPELPPTSLEALRRQAQRTHNIHKLMARSATDPTSGGSWLGAVDELTQGLSRASAGGTLYELAWHYHHSGQAESAADALQLLIDRYPQHELAGPAAIWLVQYYASSEAGSRVRHGTRMAMGDQTAAGRQASYLEPGGEPLSSAQPLATSDPLGEKPSLLVRTRVTTAAAGMNPLDRAHLAHDFGKRMHETQPQLYAQPRLQFALAAAQRQIGFTRQAEAIYRQYAQQRAHDAWWSCAAGELWLMQPSPDAPKPVAHCPRAAERPQLDGVLEESLWQHAQSLELRGGELDREMPAATALITYDREFLYVALRCEKDRAFEYLPARERRTYDADLALNDRVEFHFDLDRDYATYYTLAIDYRGFTCDACLGDKTWNPKWYVAASETKTTWTVEAAIPLSELQTSPPQPRDAWAFGVQRILPGRGLSAWNQPASVKVMPEGFGLLVFE
jgi:photosystem II stability/assembly factor-like uncharacterized protein